MKCSAPILHLLFVHALLLTLVYCPVLLLLLYVVSCTTTPCTAHAEGLSGASSILCEMNYFAIVVLLLSEYPVLLILLYFAIVVLLALLSYEYPVLLPLLYYS